VHIRFFHSILALVLFISSSGIVLHQHFCQGKLKDVAIFAKAKPCHDQHQSAKKPACPFHPPAEMPDDCCDDQTDFVKSEQDQQLSNFSYKVFQTLTSAALIPPAINWKLPIVDYITPLYRNYKPPPLVCNRSVLLQTLLL